MRIFSRKTKPFETWNEFGRGDCGNEQQTMKNSPQGKTLKDILIRHCQNPPMPEGLLLLTLPTGFGKTHYVLEYLSEHLHNDSPSEGLVCDKSEEKPAL